MAGHLSSEISAGRENKYLGPKREISLAFPSFFQVEGLGNNVGNGRIAEIPSNITR